MLLNFYVAALLFHTAAEPPEKKIHSYIIVQDYQTACDMASQALDNAPQNKQVWQLYIQALAKSGDEKLMMSIWKKYADLYPEEASSRQVLESIAWGIIEKGSQATSPLIRAYSLLGAFLGEDAVGVEIIHKKLSDSNSLVRSLALRVGSEMQDDRMKEEAFKLFKEEKVWSVHVEAIRAVGTMKIKEATNDLIEIVANPITSAEEKAAAAKALTELFEKPTKDELIKLTKSSRAALRQLACEVVIDAGDKKDALIVLPLINDSSADVRAAALQALGVNRITRNGKHDILSDVFRLLQDPHPNVGIVAAWYLTIQQNEMTKINFASFDNNPFNTWLMHPKQEIRLLAGAALVATGRYGSKWLEEAFNQAHDPYLKMNLAVGMLSQRQNIDKACHAIYQTFITNTEKWMEEKNGIFSYIGPSKVKYSDLIPNQPEVVNQLTRLEVLSLLSKMNSPRAQEAILHFLQEKPWGISGTASVLLLTEGDETALQNVEELLHHPHYKIRIQAALILSLWGKGEAAVSVLQENYFEADHELKHQILEGLGSIGSRYSIPFLIDQLNDPHQTTRIIAASSLLRCLYN